MGARNLMPRTRERPRTACTTQATRSFTSPPHRYSLAKRMLHIHMRNAGIMPHPAMVCGSVSRQCYLCLSLLLLSNQLRLGLLQSLGAPSKRDALQRELYQPTNQSAIHTQTVGNKGMDKPCPRRSMIETRCSTEVGSTGAYLARDVHTTSLRTWALPSTHTVQGRLPWKQGGSHPGARGGGGSIHRSDKARQTQVTLAQNGVRDIHMTAVQQTPHSDRMQGHSFNSMHRTKTTHKGTIATACEGTPTCNSTDKDMRCGACGCNTRTASNTLSARTLRTAHTGSNNTFCDPPAATACWCPQTRGPCM
jgi:hypothetical protein